MRAASEPEDGKEPFDSAPCSTVSLRARRRLPVGLSCAHRDHLIISSRSVRPVPQFRSGNDGHVDGRARQTLLMWPARGERPMGGTRRGTAIFRPRGCFAFLGRFETYTRSAIWHDDNRSRQDISARMKTSRRPSRAIDGRSRKIESTRSK